MLKINLKTNFKNQHQEETHKLLTSYTSKIAKKALKEQQIKTKTIAPWKEYLDQIKIQRTKKTVEDFQMGEKNSLQVDRLLNKICFREITEMIRVALLIINHIPNTQQRLTNQLHRKSIIELQFLDIKNINIF